jgi:hypothetical protein
MTIASGVCSTSFGALHDVEVVADEVVAAHVRAARLARRDHHDVRTRRRRPVAPADDPHVGSDDGTRLVDVEADAGGFRFGNVDDHDIGQLFLGDLAGYGRAHVAGASYDCHFALHESPSYWFVVSGWWLVGLRTANPTTTNHRPPAN